MAHLNSSVVSAFNVYKTGVQSLAPGVTPVLVTWDAKRFDTFGELSLSTHRFTPQTPGKYSLFGLVSIDNLAVTATFAVAIRMNSGSLTWYGNNEVTSAGYSDPYRSVAVVVTANGTTDYFDLAALQVDGVNRDLTIESYFSGHWVGE